MSCACAILVCFCRCCSPPAKQFGHDEVRERVTSVESVFKKIIFLALPPVTFLGGKLLGISVESDSLELVWEQIT